MVFAAVTAAGPAFRFSGGRSNAPPSSASSWQGLVVVPGGAPCRPGAILAKIARGRRTPSRLTNASRNALQLDEVMRSVREVLDDGDKAGIAVFTRHGRLTPERHF
jgi:hypothetical protein